MGTPSSLTDRIYNAQGGRPFAFTPMPANATPAQECAIWIYDDLRLEELGL